MADTLQDQSKRAYEAPRLVRVGSFEEVTKQIWLQDILTGAMISGGVDWSHGRVS